MLKFKKQGLFQAVVTLGLGRSFQLILGFIHLVVVINAFGGTGVSDTYFLAYSLLLLAGTVAIQSLTYTLVPVFTDIRENKGRRQAWELASTVFNISLIVLSIAAVLTFLLAPFISRLICPGFPAGSDESNLLTLLIRLLSPAVLFVAVSGVPRALFSAHQSFTIPAISALCVDAGLIAGTIFFASSYGPTASLTGGIVGAALQAALLASIFFVHRGGYRLVIRVKNEGFRRFGSLLMLRFIGLTISNINLLVDRGLATLDKGEGNVTALVTSFKIANLLPQILIWGLCEAVVAIFSRAWIRRELERIRILLQKALKALFFLSIPGAVFIAVTAYPLMALLFQRGEFTEEVTRHAILPLCFYSINLPFALVNFLLLAVLWSIEDNWAVIKLAMLGLVINITGDVIFLQLMGFSGIALANLPRGLIILPLAIRIINKRSLPLDVRDLIFSVVRLTAAGAGAFAAGKATMAFLGEGGTTIEWLVRVGAAGGAVALTYLGLCSLIARREFKAGLDGLRRRLGGKNNERHVDG